MGRYREMVWLDLDDTLFDHSYSVARGLECVQQHYPAFVSHNVDELVRLYNIALNEVYPDFLGGEIDFQEMRLRKFDRFCEKIGVPKADAPDTATFHRIYDEGYGRERRATPGSIDGVQRLRHEGIEVGVLTNGIRRTQEEKLRAIGFESLIPRLLTSEEAGAAKPDARIFLWALQRTGKTASEVVMIGDNPVNDIEGALNAGIRAIYYSPSTAGKAIATQFGTAVVMSDWTQIPRILELSVSSPDPTEALAQ